MNGKMSKEELLKWDAEHHGHWVMPMGQNAGLVFERSRGVSLYDLDGREYLDGASQLVCVTLGYKYNEEIAAAAARQIERLPYATTFWGWSSDVVIECTRRLARLTPRGLDHFFFTNGGTESAELSFQLARLFWKNQGQRKYKIISLYNSYHGTSFAALAATGVSKGLFTGGYAPLVEGFIKAPSYYCYRCQLNLEYPGCGVQCARYLENIIEMEGRNNVAAVIVEPEHGTAGCIPPPPEYFPLVRDICARNDVLLIADEVMTGFGRAGKAFGVDNWGVTPDLMALGKGITSSFIPLGGLGVNDRVWEGLKGSIAAGATYAGHPVAAAVSNQVLEIYERDKVFEHAAAMGEYARNRLAADFAGLPYVDDMGGLGLMLGIEIVEDRSKKKGFDPARGVMKKIRAAAMDKGLLLRVTEITFAPGNRITFSPPLTSDKSEIDRMLDILRAALKETLEA
ncbi:MAG: aspartate aminotransferase family protein [Thermodesulfobacteriota bacterium]